MPSSSAYIGIGSNLANPVEQVRRALHVLDTLPDSRCLARSPLYRSKPVGPLGQPDYINAVVHLKTCLLPQALLAALQAIETRHDRVRGVRWGPRTLDLDILMYADLVQDDPRLTLPHPRMHERAFVLYPLRDLDPDLIIPGRGSLAGLIQHCPPSGLDRLKEGAGTF